MNKIKKGIAVLVTMVAIMTTGVVNVYADSMSAEDLLQWEEKTYSEEYKKALNDYHEANVCYCYLSKQSENDCIEYYNRVREYYLNWGEEEAYYYTLKCLEANYIITEKDVMQIKEMFTWYDTVAEIKEHESTPAKTWTRIKMNGKVNESDEEKTYILITVTFERDIKFYFGKLLADEENETVLILPTIDDYRFDKATAIDIYFETRYPLSDESYIERDYETEVRFDGKRYVVTKDYPLHLTEEDFADFEKVHNLEFACNGNLTEEQITRSEETVSFNEIDELAKEEGSIKEVVPVEKKETVNFDEVIKAVTEEDSNLVDTNKTGEASDKTFPVLPVVIGAIVVCLIGVVIFVVIKRRKK